MIIRNKKEIQAEQCYNNISSMKTILTGAIIVLFALGLLSIGRKFEQKTTNKIVSPYAKINNLKNLQTKPSESVDLFVPYWTITNNKIDSGGYSKLIYLGITANEKGIDRTEPGYKNLSIFLQNTDPKKRKLLGVRLINQDINEKILDDKTFQKKIIADSIQIAKDNNFEGILLDFEYSALKFDQVVNKVTAFNDYFSKESHNGNLFFYITAYGDTFYRARPFDLPSIEKNIDGIYVLAYDFHKANGNPGPNFPLNLRPDEDYDFKIMTQDFISKITPDKIIVTLGLFGYDWTVGEKGASTKKASPISFSQANQNFLQSCKLQNCKVMTDQSSKETEVTYTDANGQNHDSWFESMSSIKVKKQFLSSKKINRTAIWAYSYF